MTIDGGVVPGAGPPRTRVPLGSGVMGASGLHTAPQVALGSALTFGEPFPPVPVAPTEGWPEEYPDIERGPVRPRRTTQPMDPAGPPPSVALVDGVVEHLDHTYEQLGSKLRGLQHGTEEYGKTGRMRRRARGKLRFLNTYGGAGALQLMVGALGYDEVILGMSSPYRLVPAEEVERVIKSFKDCILMPDELMDALDTLINQHLRGGPVREAAVSELRSLAKVAARAGFP